MKLLGRKKDTAPPPDSEVTDDTVDADAAVDARTPTTTAPKGRPTPKRSSGRRGPVAPAPMTGAEARRRRKELGGPKLSREERKAERLARRGDMTERREKMMAGDEAYLLPRDRGPVRRYVRDLVDSRRNVLGLFMPSALGLIFIMLGAPTLAAQNILSYAMLLLVVVMVVSGILIGRRVNRMVDEKFPDNTETGFKLGFYAASRASQLRRMRAPRPQVKRGHKVT